MLVYVLIVFLNFVLFSFSVFSGGGINKGKEMIGREGEIEGGWEVSDRERKLVSGSCVEAQSVRLEAQYEDVVVTVDGSSVSCLCS